MDFHADTGILETDFEEYLTGANHPVVGTTPTLPNVWYHGAVTYDGQFLRLYLNGVLEKEHNEQGALPRFDSVQHVAIGSALNTLGQPSGWFDGVLDELLLFRGERCSGRRREGDLDGVPAHVDLGQRVVFALDDRDRCRESSSRDHARARPRPPGGRNGGASPRRGR